MHELHRPLNKFKKKYMGWNWPSECQKSFEKIKDILTISH